MAWILLVAAGLLEVVWAIALKESHGLTRLPQTALFLIALAGSMALLAMALRTLPVGTGYAVWTGIGAVGTAVVGVALLGDPATVVRLTFIGLIAVGVIGLGVTGH
jgi:quaternary ammonium compound-resistance protein SugE